MRWPSWGTLHQPADLMLQTGGAWVREDFVWGQIESRPGQFDWNGQDRVVSTLRERGLNILGIISYGTNWASPAREDDNTPSAISHYPPDNSKYYWFVRTLVSRYKDHIRHWEVWNEPNNPLFWKPRPDGRLYAELLKTAYKAIKDVDPNIRVLTAGVSGNAVPYLEEMMAQGAACCFDILSLHPYAVPLDPKQGRVQSRPEVHKIAEVEIPKYRAFLGRHKIANKPIWVTEIGWPSGDWGLDSQAQADYLAQGLSHMLSTGLVERVFWYSFKDDSASAADAWGLVGWGAGKTDLGPKRPSFSAYSTLTRVLAGAKPAGQAPFGSYAVVEDFEQGGAWARSTHPQGAMASSPEQKWAGNAAGKLQYNFATTNQAVDFAPPGGPKAIPGRPARIGVWARGDNSGNYLSAWLRDRDGELFKARLGATSAEADGWRYYETRIQNYYFEWERAGGSPANGTPDYPLQFASFRLENTPDEPAGGGTIYLDNLQVSEGPDVTAARFTRTDGQVVDALWSVEPRDVQLPTRSTSAQVTDRDGAARSVEAKGGVLSLKVGSSPIYVLHKPAEGSAPQQSGGGSGGPAPNPAAACKAMARAPQIGGALYFPETGHNLYGGFRAYWERNGGIAVFGFPITEEFAAPSSDGKQYVQQYFQRARLEWHPKNGPPYDLQLGLMGTWLAGGRNFPRIAADAAPAGSLYFGETGHSLRLFRGYWERNGGLAVFGFPISEEMQERNPADGKTYTVQYFERNRLEHHPEHAGTAEEVMLGLLGVEYLAQQGCPK
jgi:polysaccharide biosynthesis protein PslG